MQEGEAQALPAKVVVVGARRVGKTSLLSYSITRDTCTEYEPTTHMDTFYDVARNLEIIDTPGLEDRVLEEVFFSISSPIKEHTDTTLYS